MLRLRFRFVSAVSSPRPIKSQGKATLKTGNRHDLQNFTKFINFTKFYKIYKKNWKYYKSSFWSFPKLPQASPRSPKASPYIRTRGGGGRPGRHGMIFIMILNAFQYDFEWFWASWASPPAEVPPLPVPPFMLHTSRPCILDALQRGPVCRRPFLDWIPVPVLRHVVARQS